MNSERTDRTWSWLVTKVKSVMFVHLYGLVPLTFSSFSTFYIYFFSVFLFISYIYFYFHLNRQGKTEGERKPIAYIQFSPRGWEEGAYKKAQFTFVIMRPNSSSDSSLLHTGSDAVSTTWSREEPMKASYLANLPKTMDDWPRPTITGDCEFHVLRNLEEDRPHEGATAN